MLGHDRRSMADEVTQSADGPQAWIDEGALAALMTATHGDPFSVLGMHVVADAVVVRALLPGADVSRRRTRPDAYSPGFSARATAPCSPALLLATARPFRIA
jgi:hypothetical protein